MSDLLNPSILISCVTWHRRKGEQTRQAILDAAIARFGREGYRATSVADIARDAGVGGTVAYAYFPNKEALFLAAIDEDAAGVIHEGLDSVIDDPDDRRLAPDADLHAGRARSTATRWPAGCSPASSPRSPSGCSRSPPSPSCARPCAERIRAEQLAGTVRPDIDPVAIGNGVVVDHAVAADVGGAARPATPPRPTRDDVAAVFEAALDPAPPRR